MIEIARTQQGTFLCEHDVYRFLPDGRRYLVARAGQYIPMAQATELGLVGAVATAVVEPSRVKEGSLAGLENNDAPRHTVEVNATTDAKALAEENGVDLAMVKGGGKNGRILKSDVEALIG